MLGYLQPLRGISQAPHLCALVFWDLQGCFWWWIAWVRGHTHFQICLYGQTNLRRLCRSAMHKRPLPLASHGHCQSRKPLPLWQVKLILFSVSLATMSLSITVCGLFQLLPLWIAVSGHVLSLFFYSSVHSFNKHLSSPYYVLDTVWIRDLTERN